MDKAYLVLENGTVFEGHPFGAAVESVGELVFTTLTKEGMPVLRYRTRDLCSLLPGQCDCAVRAPY